MASDPNLGLSLPQHVKYFGLAPIRIVINSSIGSLHSQSWAVDKINVLQTDMATTKVQLDHLKEQLDHLKEQPDHLKESVDTKTSNFQTMPKCTIAMMIDYWSP